MAPVYFDASAVVKLLVDEDGSDAAASLWDDADLVLSSRLVYPEVRAALAAAGRNHDLDPAGLDAATSLWEQYWHALGVVELTSEVAARAGQLAGDHSLRGADAVHLASALAVGLPGLVLAAWDVRLARGAAAAGLTVVPSP